MVARSSGVGVAEREALAGIDQVDALVADGAEQTEDDAAGDLVGHTGSFALEAGSDPRADELGAIPFAGRRK
ncbi:MAG: hypothetical protein WKF40_08190 [Thermoleophilaceae bacterium]